VLVWHWVPLETPEAFYRCTSRPMPCSHSECQSDKCQCPVSSSRHYVHTPQLAQATQRATTLGVCGQSIVLLPTHCYSRDSEREQERVRIPGAALAQNIPPIVAWFFRLPFASPAASADTVQCATRASTNHSNGCTPQPSDTALHRHPSIVVAHRVAIESLLRLQALGGCGSQSTIVQQRPAVAC
jgi:hypothetical protein